MEVDRKRYTLRDVWFAITTERNFNYSFWLEITMQILFTEFLSTFGRFLVLVVVLLVLSLGYVGFFVVLPDIAAFGSTSFFFHIACGLFIIYNIYFNYFLVVYTNPGNPSQSLDSIAEEGDSLDYKTCKKCNKAKPPRTHHCSICKRCILKMDHHCPYVANW
jgi:palmitoyltransferase